MKGSIISCSFFTIDRLTILDGAPVVRDINLVLVSKVSKLLGVQIIREQKATFK
jgi:hypothetical protein